MRYQRLLDFVQFAVLEGPLTQFVLSVLPPGELRLIIFAAQVNPYPG
ncbi:hypothetical protein [Deinococcus navajonensis]|uniref:DedA family protein n=1 Tax=Deinococcus navajonensis TaxID=309884 RepID=A0ABV8XQP3_9DEIO